MRPYVLSALLTLFGATTMPSQSPVPRATRDVNLPLMNTAQARRELERAYQANTAAYMAHDLAAIMELRHPDFHSVTPDGARRDYTAMRTYIEGFLNSVKKWNRVSFTIDSLTLAGDTAHAVVNQYVDRMALRPDNQVHHVQTWVTQRESWIRSGTRWLLWRVDQLRNQRRLIDGQEG